MAEIAGVELLRLSDRQPFGRGKPTEIIAHPRERFVVDGDGMTFLAQIGDSALGRGLRRSVAERRGGHMHRARAQAGSFQIRKRR